MRPTDHRRLALRTPAAILTAMLAAALLLPACSLSQKKVREVDARVDASRELSLTCPQQRADRCAADSPLLELGRTAMGEGRHYVALLEHGEQALQIRLHLIRAAREYVDLQNFILRKDDTGELILGELLQAARRGVTVRLLLDQMFSLSDAEYLVALTMAHRNLEIRFYNPSFNKAEMAKHDWISAVACCFSGFNQRMHNKLLVVDDLVGIVGGRNIADRYFDYDTNYNFKDRDVAVYGATAAEMRTSFDWFWESPETVPVQYLRDVAAELLAKPPDTPTPYVPPARLAPQLARAADARYVREAFVDTALQVDQLEYFSDRPRKRDLPDSTAKKNITLELYDVLDSARHSVVIQSPYMVLSKRARKSFAQLRQRNPGIELVFSTNSLAATDADTVYGHTHRHKNRYIDKLGFHMYEFKPFPADAPEFFPRWPQLMAEKKQGVRSGVSVSGDNSTIPMPAPRVGLHSKSFVVDGRVAMIGSHNFDPRSERFNTENGLIVWDEAFAQTLERLIRRDIEPQNSWVVAMRPDREQQKTAIATPPGNNTEFLPWFYGSTSVYELAPGKEPLPPDSPDFYRHYYSVGSFPEVIRTRRQLNVLFLGSFFFFLEPIL
jgi:phosphatidylserine/phosphatidylglycerophosphate/cardiolipin synthase-like enzyme